MHNLDLTPTSQAVTVGHYASAARRNVRLAWGVFVWRWDASLVLRLCQLVLKLLLTTRRPHSFYQKTRLIVSPPLERVFC